MKLDQLIVQYLYKNKSVSLQEIGTYTLSPDVVIPLESEKDFNLPENAISYVYNLKTKPDEGLIDFIVQQTRKIKPLAASDLESYSNLNKQFLNIGKPLIIEGLGTLQKNQEGIYEFSQSHFFNTKTSAQPVEIKEKQNEEVSFSTSTKKEKNNKNSKSWVYGLILLFIVLGAASLIYYFNLPKKEAAVLPVVETVQDTVPVVTDSLPIPIDSTLTSTPPTTPADGYTFKVVIKNYTTKAAADAAFKRLTSFGHKLILTTKDSLTYQLKMPFTSPLSDTSRAKDSLAVFFNAKTTIDLN